MSKRGILLKSGYLSTVVLSSMKMVADRHRHAAYHNKHWWRASYECQHRWPWTLKLLISSDFLAIFGCKRVNCDDEMDGDRPRLPANKNCHKLSHVSWALAQISCLSQCWLLSVCVCCRHHTKTRPMSMHWRITCIGTWSLTSRASASSLG